jgi:hypothetical protein
LPDGGRSGRFGNAAVRVLIAGTKNSAEAGGREDGSSESTASTLAGEEFAVQHRRGKNAVPVWRTKRAVSQGIPPATYAGPPNPEPPSSEGHERIDGW